MKRQAGLSLMPLLAPILVTTSVVATMLVACTSPPSTSQPTDSGTWFVEVEEEGGYWLGPDTLQMVGSDPLDESPPELRLSWNGRDVPYFPSRTDKGWGLFLFAADHATRYTRRTAFRLDVGVPGTVMQLEEATAAASPAGGLVTLHREEDQRYLPQADAVIPWFWEPLYTPGVITHTVELDEALPGPITVTLHLWSHTASSANPDHLLRLKWDGQQVGEWEWDGLGMQHLTASWDEAHPGGEHALAFEAPELPGVSVAMAWLDGWDVTYRRQVEADGTIWRAEGTATHVGAGIEGYVLDVTDPFAPQGLRSIPAEGTVGTVPGHRYWAGELVEASSPLEVRPAQQVDLDDLGDVTYLALAPAEFHVSLQTLLEHRRGQGLETTVVTPQAVYDTFGNGRPAPEAIRAMVQSLPGLRYLLVVGDGAAESDGYDGDVGLLRVVVPLARTTVLGETPNDAFFGYDGNGKPSVAVGRLPASTPGEVAAMVEKTILWETQEATPEALLLSDDEAEFSTLIGEIAALLPPGIPTQRVDAGEEGSREKALELLRDGPVWLNYNGHGSLTLLCDEGILTLEDGKSWRKPVLVVAWTCLAAHYIHPTQVSMAETWLREPKGGAVAFLGPVGETTTGEQTPFARVFYQALLEKQRMGDAWLAALQAGGSQDVARGFVILGDPALQVLGE